MKSDRVVIIHGETGCGKSSRIPVKTVLYYTDMQIWSNNNMLICMYDRSFYTKMRWPTTTAVVWWSRSRGGSPRAPWWSESALPSVSLSELSYTQIVNRTETSTHISSYVSVYLHCSECSILSCLYRSACGGSPNGSRYQRWIWRRKYSNYFW